MSFSKAQSLLRLADMAAARHGGVTLDDIADEFGVNRRTAQRMARSLADRYPGVETTTREDRKKAWRLRGRGGEPFRGVDDAELAALDLAERLLRREGDEAAAGLIRGLRDRTLAAMSPVGARRAEADAEALLEAQGLAARPGPRSRAAPGVAAAIRLALKAPWRLRIRYAGEAEERLLEPYGLLIGARRYLVARQPEKGRELRHFRIDRIAAARTTTEAFVRDEGFDLEAHAARAFGAYQSEEEMAETVWRFAPRAAETARDFLFHPGQEMAEEPDGSLTVRFRASGRLEMAWHLYQWGDAVEVLAPPELSRMVEGWRRTDFPSLP